jgi:hypothetical protein
MGGMTVSEQRAEFAAKSPELQERIRKILAEDMAKEGPISQGIKQKAGDFKGPEGFGKVVGVGANPVMEAMSAQLEEAKKQTALLDKIANPGIGMPDDFTKK